MELLLEASDWLLRDLFRMSLCLVMETSVPPRSLSVQHLRALSRVSDEYSGFISTETTASSEEAFFTSYFLCLYFALYFTSFPYFF